ncbi:MAG: hypothetical protein AAFY10_01190 [Pseudomonadota bacterium]
MFKASTLALIMSLGLGTAVAQESTGSVGAPPNSSETDNTDQSEEDWRRSQRKESGDRNDPISNPSTIGVGVNFPEPREIDRLPEESRRHLNRQRARVIAEVDLDNPQPQDIAYEPSEAAKSDPQLMRDEQAAWEEMIQGMTGSGGASGGSEAGQSPIGGTGSGGGGTVVIADTPGQGGGGSAGTTMGGGANQSAAEILRQMQGLGRSQSGSAQPVSSPAGSEDGSRGGEQHEGASASETDASTGDVGTAGQAAGSQPSGQTESSDGAGDAEASGSGSNDGDAAEPESAGEAGNQSSVDEGAASAGELEAGPSVSGQSTSASDHINTGQSSGSEQGADTPSDRSGDSEASATDIAGGSQSSDAKQTGSGDPADASPAQVKSPIEEQPVSDRQPPPRTAPSQPLPPQTRNLWLEVIEKALQSEEQASEQIAEQSSSSEPPEWVSLRERIEAARRR